MGGSLFYGDHFTISHRGSNSLAALSKLVLSASTNDGILCYIRTRLQKIKQ